MAGAASLGWASTTTERFLVVLTCVLLLALLRLYGSISALQSALDTATFQLDTEKESARILADELELRLAPKANKKGGESPTKGKIGAFWNGTSAGTQETDEEKELRVALYLEEVGGMVCQVDQVLAWAKDAERAHTMQRDVDRVTALLSKALKDGNKTEAMHEALFILSQT